MGRMSERERLQDLERTVDVLNGRLRDVQWMLQQVKGASMSERLWGTLIATRQRRVYMSDVCNRRVRPNTKVTHDAIAHTRG